MKILMTGVSSFTGYWFARHLASAGNVISAPLRGEAEISASEIRAQRLRNIAPFVTLIPRCPFGSERFLELIKAESFDVLCHHASEVGNYKSSDFDIVGALDKNTLNLKVVLSEMKKNGTKSVVLTGSLFEQNEGCGNQPLNAFSSYGLSKGFTAEIFRHACLEKTIPLGKFVIPNPFGPFEEPRLGAYLLECWRQDRPAIIKNPDYIRDNIHVRLLADCYAKFVTTMENTDFAFRKLNPSGYVESQGTFVERIATELRKRTGRSCQVELIQQIDFQEPMIRANYDSAVSYIGDSNEAPFWDEYAAFF